VTITILVAIAIIVPGSWQSAAAATCWQPPVEAPVTDPFRAPTCPYCAGNRGIEYGTPAGSPVRAVAAGRVTFAGAVAGTVYVVVEHADRLRVTYGNLDDRTVGVGDAVVRGMLLGVTAGRFHLGLRRNDTYLDPNPFIGVWRGIVRLVPTDGSPGVTTHERRLVCGGPRSGA
jgi:murein DD-endopeptidase MepM/ murein hydrolase activator NlpD